jgi:hypothetical protein
MLLPVEGEIMRIRDIAVIGLALPVMGAGALCHHAAYCALLGSAVLHWAPSIKGTRTGDWHFLLQAVGYGGLLLGGVLKTLGHH